jgi:ABC-type Mn2+/Zn2+ transport system ATPase subunit
VAPNPDPKVIEITGVSLRRDGRQVLRDITFSIGAQELVGVIGPNGGGKTTLLQVILGVLKPDRGSVRVFGRDPRRMDGHRGDIGYVAQSKLFEREFPARAKDVVLMGTFPQVGFFRFPGARDRTRALEALEHVGMLDRANRPIGRLSGGEQQRVFIAQALVSRPKLLILDEPTVGVDREGEEALLHLLLRLKRESALTILMVSHNVSLIRAHTDRILCLSRELCFAGDAAGLTDQVIAQAYHAHRPEDGDD